MVGFLYLTVSASAVLATLTESEICCSPGMAPLQLFLVVKRCQSLYIQNETLIPDALDCAA